MSTQLPDAPRPEGEGREGLTAAALLFILLALLTLAATPTLLVSRVSRTNHEILTVILPAYEAVRHAGAAMERRLSAAHSAFITGAPEEDSLRLASRAEEAAALGVLRLHAPRLSAVAEFRVLALQRLALRRDSLERVLRWLPEPLATYPVALTRFDVITDSMQLQLDGLRGDLLAATTARFRNEMAWASRWRVVAGLLGLVAAAAASAVGWFGWRDRRLKRALRKALLEAEWRRSELERVTESRERLVRGFSHDVKNPLGAASGHLQLLAMGLQGQLTAEQTRSVGRATNSIDAALAIVEDLLELARIENGSLEVTPVPTDLRALVLDVAEVYRAQVEAAGLALHVIVPGEAPSLVTDRRRVAQVLGNLVSNAVKYTRHGAVTLRLESPAAGRVGITVEDTGPGIPGEQQHRLFQEFTRLDPEAAQGSGVGLTISQRIAESLQGEITVWSREGAGSAFTLWLPLAGAEAPGPAAR